MAYLHHVAFKSAGVVTGGSKCMRVSEIGYKRWSLYQYSRRRAQWSCSTWSPAVAVVVNFRFSRYPDFVSDHFQSFCGPTVIYLLL